MNSGATVLNEARRVVAVRLTCISCGKVEEVHVFRDRKPPGRILWECFDCQKREPRAGICPEAG